MNIKHLVSISVACCLIVFLYYFGNTIPPKIKASVKSNSANSDNTVAPASMNAGLQTILLEAESKLPADKKEELKAIENELKTIRDTSRMVSVFLRLSEFWESNQFKIPAAYYKGFSGVLENSKNSITFAAQTFLLVFRQEENSKFRQWEIQQARYFGEQSYRLDSNNEETKLVLAEAYLEEASEPMTGVRILLDLVKKNPNDMRANILLGRMSVKSGQWEKAKIRFETVLKQDSLNEEALYFSAEVFSSTGNNIKASEFYEKCKRVTKDKELIQKIESKLTRLNK